MNNGQQKQTRCELSRYQRAKMRGAIESLEHLVRHCDENSIEISRQVVIEYITATKNELLRVERTIPQQHRREV